jgi:hypothetical protein
MQAEVPATRPAYTINVIIIIEGNIHRQIGTQAVITTATKFLTICKQQVIFPSGLCTGQYEIGFIMSQKENPFPKPRTNCLLCSGRAPTAGEHVSNNDHLSSNVTAVF